MALNTCTECSTLYAIGIDSCPHCGSTEYVEEDMAKISRLGGATVEGEVASTEDVAAAEVVELPEGDVEAADVAGEPVSVYETYLLTDLRDECETRGLSKTGNKAELVERLVADDEARAEEPAEDAEADEEVVEGQ